MYNEAIKEQYLATLQGTVVDTMRQRFERLAKDEERLGRDLLEFTKSDLAMAFSSYGFLDVKSVRVLLSTFSAYNQWAKSTGQNLRFSNATEDFDARVVELYVPSVSQRLVSSPDELVAKVLRIYPIDEGHTVIPIVIFAWLGFSANDAISIKNADINCQQRRILMKDSTLYPYAIPDCFWEPLEIYAKTRVSERMGSAVRKVDADDLGFFLHRMVTSKSTKAGNLLTSDLLTSRITEFRNAYKERFHEPINFTYQTIMQSGRYYRLYQAELSGVDLYAKENKDLVLELGKGKMVKDVLTIYEAYRKAFYPR